MVWPLVEKSLVLSSLERPVDQREEGMQVWGDEAGDAGARSSRATSATARFWVLCYQRKEVIAWLLSGAQGNSSCWKTRCAVTHILLQRWYLYKNMEIGDWVPEWFRTCLCSNPTFPVLCCVALGCYLSSLSDLPLPSNEDNKCNPPQFGRED